MQVIEQAQNRAFNDYRTMMDANHSSEPSIDSGYISGPSMSNLSRSMKGKERATDLLGEYPMPSRAEFDDALASTEAVIPPCVGKDPSDFQNMVDDPRFTELLYPEVP